MMQLKLMSLILRIFYWMKSYENVLIYSISYKTLIGTKPWRYRFDKLDDKKYDAIYDKISYLISQKVISHMLFIIVLQGSKLIHATPYY